MKLRILSPDILCFSPLWTLACNIRDKLYVKNINEIGRRLSILDSVGFRGNNRDRIIKI